MIGPCHSSPENLAELAAQEAADAIAEIEDGLAAIEREYALACTRQAAFELSRQASGALGVTPMEAMEALADLPENTLCFLDSPQGWTALVAYIANQLGASDTGYAPTVH
ncbi:MAG: hypothetical protein H6915_05360 [Novosphingobium sp.]|nr:hypothetical protein [Novosphingobium sp.]